MGKAGVNGQTEELADGYSSFLLHHGTRKGEEEEEENNAPP